MPNWKKVIVSGSDAVLSSLAVTGTINSSGSYNLLGSGGQNLFFNSSGQLGSSATGWHIQMTPGGNTTYFGQVGYHQNGLNITPGGNSTTYALSATVGSYPAATIASFVSGSVTALTISGSGMRGTGSFSYLGGITATSFTGSLSGTSTSATSASFASTASYVNTLNQAVLITGSATIGATSAGASENTLTLGARDTTSEGGQLGLNAPGGTYISASFIDLYQNRLRVLKGTNASSTAEVASWNMHTLQAALPAYNSVSAFPGTAVATLGVDSGGNILTISTGGSGTVTSVSASGTVSGITLGGGPITSTGTLTLSGTISGLTNSNLSGTAGITNANLANSSITIGSTAISLGATSTTLAGLTNVTSTNFTGTASWASNAIQASSANTAGTATSATSATNAIYASQVTLTNLTASAGGPFYPTFTAATATGSLLIDNSTFYYAPTTNTLTVTSSYAITASVAESVLGTVTSASYAVTASHAIRASSSYIGSTSTGTWSIIGVNASGYTQPFNFTGFTLNAATNTLSTTASWATNAASATSATSAGSVTNAVTFNNGGAGDASGTSFNGSAARTISYNTIGAPKTDGTNATGTWGISISGNAATATSATSATSATNATNATNTAITDTTTGAGPYYLTFVDSTSGNLAQRVDSTGLTYNATTNAITASIFKGELVGTASYAGIALTATNATSASYATTANFAYSANQAGEVTTTDVGTNAIYYPTFVDSANGSPLSEKVWTNSGFQLNPGAGTLRLPTVLATSGITGSLFGNSVGTASWATNAVTATSATSATTATSATSATTSTYVLSADTRAVASTPETNNAAQGVRFDFKQNSTNGLSDGGTYNGVMYFRKYGSGTDWSGGGAHEVGFSDNGNLHHRYGTSTTWGSWYKILDSNNYNSYSPTLTGTGATGTWNITSSWATRAVTASYALTASLLLGTIASASYATSSSFAATSSWATNATNAGASDAVYMNAAGGDISLLGTPSPAPGYATPETDQQLGWVVSNPTMTSIQVRPNGLGTNVYFGALTNLGEGLVEATQGRIYYYCDRHIWGNNAYGYTGNLDSVGNFDAANDITCGGTKFFDIPHQTKEGWGLKHAAIEGPESAVYFRGKLDGNDVIQLPDYWQWLVHEETITVTLTPAGQYQALYIKDIKDNKVLVGSDGDYIKCHYVVYGERKDVDRWDVEYPEYSRTNK